MEHYQDYLSPEQLLRLRKLPQSLPLVRGPKEPVLDGSDQQRAQINEMLTNHHAVLTEERVVRKGNISTGVWNVQHSYVEITSQKGSYWNYFGQKIQDTLTLNAEEALFLIEQGCLEVYYGGLPLSVQQAWSMLQPKAFSLDHYMVYAHLLRLGYVVVRHQKRLDDVSLREQEYDLNKHPSLKDKKDTRKGADCSNDDIDDGVGDVDDNDDNADAADGDDDVLKQCPVSHLWSDDKGCRPLVRPRDAKSTSSILSKLQVIKTHRMDTTAQLLPGLSHHIDFDVYLPGAHFKKSEPGLPAFRISVSRFADPPPSLAVINTLTVQCNPVPLKFALVSDGTITFESFIDVEIPTYAIK